MQFLKIMKSGFVIDLSQILSILVEISSQPCALFIFSPRMCSNMFCSVNVTLFIMASVTLVMSGGTVLSVTIVLHWSLKYSLYMLHFSSMSVVNLLLCKMGGIIEAHFFLIVFLGLTNIF